MRMARSFCSLEIKAAHASLPHLTSQTCPPGSGNGVTLEVVKCACQCGAFRMQPKGQGELLGSGYKSGAVQGILLL